VRLPLALVRVPAAVHHPRPARLDPCHAVEAEVGRGGELLRGDGGQCDAGLVGLVDGDCVGVVEGADLAVGGLGAGGTGGGRHCGSVSFLSGLYFQGLVILKQNCGIAIAGLLADLRFVGAVVGFYTPYPQAFLIH
jgi:hypothetical protein